MLLLISIGKCYGWLVTQPRSCLWLFTKLMLYKIYFAGGTKKATMGQQASTSQQRGVLTQRLTSFSNAQTFTKRRRLQGQNHWRGKAHYLKTIIPSKKLRRRLTKPLPGKGRSTSMNKKETMELQQYSTESGLTTSQS